MSWSKSDHQARIVKTGHRHRAGSPAGREIDCYRHEMLKALDAAQSHRVLVLGMTPELRQLAADADAQVTSIEMSREAIDIYNDWVTPDIDETIIQDNWLALDPSDHGSFGAILGDGVFPNLLTVKHQSALMEKLAQCLAPAGSIITRHPVLPGENELGNLHWKFLVEKFRNAEICEDAFGLSMRLWGTSHCEGVMRDGLLDNAASFAQIEDMYKRSDITIKEYEIARRFQYFGKNLFMHFGAFEKLAEDFGMEITDHNVSDGFWSQYYLMLTIGKDNVAR